MRIKRHHDFNQSAGYGGLTCSTVRNWIEQSKEMNNVELTAYAEHLELCAGCRRAEANEQLIRAVIVPSGNPPVSEPFNANLMAQLGLEPLPVVEPIRRRAEAPAYTRPIPVHVKGSRRARGGTAGSHRWVWLGSLATVVLTMIGVIIYYAGMFSKPLALIGKGLVAVVMNFTDAIVPILSQIPLVTQWLPIEPPNVLHLLMISVTLTLATLTVGWVARR